MITREALVREGIVGNAAPLGILVIREILRLRISAHRVDMVIVRGWEACVFTR